MPFSGSAPACDSDAVDGNLQAVLARRADDDVPDGPPRIHHDALLGAQGAFVNQLSAQQAHLLADGDDYLQRRVRQALLLENGDRLQNGSDAGFIVGAEDRRAIAADDAVANDGLDARILAHGIHMCAEQEPVATIAVEPGDDVAVFVDVGGQAKGRQPRL